MLYDCFIFNNELDLLKLRLSFLDEVVDYFVLVEAPRTLSGNSKPLYYEENKALYRDYHHKIIHLKAPLMPELKDWEYEYFQRDYIKKGLENCREEDLVLISDVDEIVNLKPLLGPDIQLPALVELPYYYYYFNLKANKSFAVNLFCKYAFIKDMFIGERNNTYKLHVNNIISQKKYETGWHFSYLFGEDIERYKEKVRSFSHQEFNNDYFLNDERIKNCIHNGIDLFERKDSFFFFQDPQKDLQELLVHIKKTGMEEYIFYPSMKKNRTFANMYFVLQKKTLPYLLLKLYKEPRYWLIVQTSPFRKKIKRLFKNNTAS